MKVCIAGGGRVGRYLAQNLLANRHKVVIIEPVEAQCRMLADTLDISVICGELHQHRHPAHRRRWPAATPLWP